MEEYRERQVTIAIKYLELLIESNRIDLNRLRVGVDWEEHLKSSSLKLKYKTTSSDGTCRKNGQHWEQQRIRSHQIDMPFRQGWYGRYTDWLGAC